MRHRRKTVKLGRRADHRDALLANLACSLIEHNRIKTTVAKAKALRPFVEKLVTKARLNTVHARRLVAGKLGPNSHRVEKVVRKLFGDIAPLNATRPGGYTRIIKLGQRQSDAAPMAFIEFVEIVKPVEVAPIPEAKPAKKAPAKKSEKKSASESEAAAEAPAAEEAKPARKPRAKKTEEEKGE
jgi:large subunit ribosomal protein L17